MAYVLVVLGMDENTAGVLVVATIYGSVALVVVAYFCYHAFVAYLNKKYPDSPDEEEAI